MLIQRLKAGDHDAFDQIYRRHVAMVYRQAVRLMGNDAEAEEVAQEVFLVIYQKAKTFRGESAFSTWIYRLTVNMALTKLRRRKRGEEVSFDDYLPRFQDDGHHQVRPVVDWSQEIEAPLAQKEVRQILQRAIDQLSPLDKAVVVQSDLEGVANREIGENLGLSVPAVKARLHRARLFLRGRVAVHLGHSPT
ncbi:MAG: RNA polymerase sigma factor [Candidatus Methylomirabilaceae bacterium]